MYCFVDFGFGIKKLGDDEWGKDHAFRIGMVVNAEGDHKAEEHSGRAAWATVQLWGLHDALNVSISMLFC